MSEIRLTLRIVDDGRNDRDRGGPKPRRMARGRITRPMGEPSAKRRDVLAVDFVEAARLVGVCVARIQRAVGTGELRAVDLGRGIRRIRFADLEDWIARMLRTADGEDVAFYD